jgi:branched-chain amino acid transport system substrate-binding protein
MTRHGAIALVLLLAAAVMTPTTTFSQPAPIEINVILPATGPAAFLGSEEAKGYGVVADVVNKAGGIKGRPVRFVIQDDASVPANSVQLLSGLIAKKINVVLGSAIVATCSAMAPLAERNGGPAMYCLSPLLQTQNGQFAFSAAVAPKDFEPVMARFARAHGWNRIAVLNSIDATGQSMEAEFDSLLQSSDGRGLQIVAREHFSGSDISVAAQVAQIKAQNPQVILSFAAGAGFGTMLRGLHDGGVDVPVFGAAGNMVSAQLAQYAGFIPKQLYFFITGGVAPNTYAPPQVKTAERAYFDAFKAAGIEPAIAQAISWDTGTLIVDVLRAVGPDASSQQIRDYLEHLRGWAGVFGVYDFQQFPHRGLGPSATVVYRWDPAKRTFTVLPLPAR